jgi:hypothetical protein
MLRIATVILTLTAALSFARAEEKRTQMFVDPNMNSCWFGEAPGCEAWSRSDGYATVNLVCRQIGKPGRCMPAEQAFDIALIGGPAQDLIDGGDPNKNEQNRTWLVMLIVRAADRARAASSDVAVDGLRAAIAATVPEQIRWDGFRQMLKEKGL